MIRILILILITCLCSGCMQTRQNVKRPLGNDGELFLYCEPFSQESGRLQFSIEAISAVREDGLVIPLIQEVQDFSFGDLQRQRLVARGILPAGIYKGIAIKLKKASLATEDGKGQLLVPEKPVENQAQFTIKSGKASLMTMELNYRESVPDQILMNPAFIFRSPTPPLLELTGYITNHSANTLTVFDRRSARVSAMIETGRGPAGIVLDQVRMLGYVAFSGEDAIGVLDIKENDFIERIRLSPGDEPRFLAITPDGRLAISANTRSNTASIIDLQSRFEVARVPVGNGPEYVLMDRNGRRAFVFSRLTNSISIIDMTTRAVTGTLATESGPVYGQLSNRGDRLYVYHDMSPNILVFALDGQTMTRRINTGMGVRALKINPLNDLIYVGKNFGDIIDIYDPFTLTGIDFLNANGGTNYMTIDGEENNLLVLHPRNRQLRFINLISKKERGLLDTGADPYCAVILNER